MKEEVKQQKKSYTSPHMDEVSVDVRAHMLTLSDGVIGTKVEHDDRENAFTKESNTQSLWDIQW